jgi:hypothetical protein
MKLKDLDVKQKAAILDAFIDHLDGVNAKYGSVMGTLQIINKLDSIAVKKGFIPCPCCGRRT